MKKLNPFSIATILMFFFMLSSCDAIAGIFKAGMDFGSLIAIAIVAIIVFVFMKTRKNKS